MLHFIKKQRGGIVSFYHNINCFCRICHCVFGLFTFMQKWWGLDCEKLQWWRWTKLETWNLFYVTKYFANIFFQRYVIWHGWRRFSLEYQELCYSSYSVEETDSLSIDPIQTLKESGTILDELKQYLETKLYE